jgi:pilus assembly protein Flp/PilA
MFVTAYETTRRSVADVLRHKNNERGATAVEYALMIALIAAVIIGAVTLLGSHTSGAFGNYNSQFASAS